MTDARYELRCHIQGPHECAICQPDARREPARYFMTQTTLCGQAWQDLEPSNDGDWVSYEDYRALADQLAASERELEAIRVEQMAKFGWVRK